MSRWAEKKGDAAAAIAHQQSATAFFEDATSVPDVFADRLAKLTP